MFYLHSPCRGRFLFGFKGGLFGINTCYIHYRPSMWMIQSIIEYILALYPAV